VKQPGGSTQQRALGFLSKVPEIITIYFWIAKLLTTAMGEATSDYLVYGRDMVSDTTTPPDR
jgi:uncharacterized membrane-anchored protein